MNNSVLHSFIDSAKSILILLPTNPHFDQVAAGLSLYLSLRPKKEVSVSCPSSMLVEFNRLIGVDKVSPELGKKNLIIRFSEYPQDNFENVSYELDNGEVKLIISPKPMMPAPQKEQVVLSYSGVSADSIILIGGGSDSHFPALSLPELKSAKFIHVGTRVLNINPPLEVLSLAKAASSASEVVAQILKEHNLTIDADIATNLIMGVEEGSRSFSSPDTTADTFALFAELMRLGGKRTPKNASTDKRNFPPGSIPQVPFTQPQRAPKAWYEPKIFKGSGTTVV